MVQKNPGFIASWMLFFLKKTYKPHVTRVSIRQLNWGHARIQIFLVMIGRAGDGSEKGLLAAKTKGTPLEWSQLGKLHQAVGLGQCVSLKVKVVILQQHSQSLIALEPLLIGPHPRRETIVIKMLKTIKVSVRHCAEAGGTSSVCFKRLLIVYVCNFLHKSILFFWSKRSKLRPWAGQAVSARKWMPLSWWWRVSSALRLGDHEAWSIVPPESSRDNWLDNRSLLAFFLSPSYCLYSPSTIPGIASQANYIHLNSCLRGCFWGKTPY